MAAVKPKSQVAFQLDEIFPSSGESSRIATPYASQHATPGPSRPPSPSSGRRVFEVQQPPPAQSKAARWLLMTLIVNANLVQVRQRLPVKHARCRQTDSETPDDIQQCDGRRRLLPHRRPGS